MMQLKVVITNRIDTEIDFFRCVKVVFRLMKFTNYQNVCKDK
jgi:hypothetical protein